MMTRPNRNELVRKRRTRQHEIADLSVNHVERLALRSSCTVERLRSDYGLDLLLFSYNARGEAENGLVYIQVKATDRLRLTSRGAKIACRVQRSDLVRWLAEQQPVILILYDAKQERAYWLYVQAYFESLPRFRLSSIGRSTTVHFSVRDVVDEAAIKQFTRFRDQVNRQRKGRVKHEL
jgi:hypothetical protein